MVGYIAAILALGAGIHGSYYDSYNIGTPICHRTFLRHLINMGIVSIVETAIRVATVPPTYNLVFRRPVRRIMGQDRENLVGIRNVAVAKLLES